MGAVNSVMTGGQQGRAMNGMSEPMPDVSRTLALCCGVRLLLAAALSKLPPVAAGGAAGTRPELLAQLPRAGRAGGAASGQSCKMVNKRPCVRSW